MKRLVSDTGPLLHLQEAEALHLLPLIGNVFIPPLVADELHLLAPNLPLEFAKTQTLSVTAQRRSVEWQRAGLLHGGEAEALALSLEIRTEWFLTDDAAARLMAESLNVEARGSIGIILWSATNQLVDEPEAKSLFANLEKSTL